MNKSLYIFFGGFLGGLMRYLVGIFEKSLFGTGDYSILTVNLVGAFLLSTINYYAIKKKKIRVSFLLDLSVGDSAIF